MSTFDGSNFYFSGQGVVMVGDRDSTTGKPKGLVPVGNVSALKLGLATTVIEHKESQSGNRAIDLRLVTELKSSMSMTVENFSASGLANALAGTWAQNVGSSVVGEASKLYLGKVMAMANIKVSAVTVKRNTGTPQALTAYVNTTTAYDYLLNTDAGSVKFNDGTVLACDKMTTGSDVTAPTTVTVAATAGAGTTFGWASAVPADIVTLGVGGRLITSGLAGADAALVNNISGVITAIDTGAKTVKVAIDTYGSPAKVITIGTPKLAYDGQATTFDYTYATQNRIDAMTAVSTEKYLRFEGLNTADGGNPVIVEVYRFLVDPLKELALIGEGIGPFVLDGNTLADNLQLTGSKFFKVTQLR